MQSMEILAELIMALPLSSFLEPTHEDETFPMPEPKKVFSLDHHHRSPSTRFYSFSA